MAQKLKNKKTGLRISNKKTKQKLTKEQKAFNRLTKKIEQLEKAIKDDVVMLDNLLKFRTEHVQPLTVTYAEKELDFVLCLDEATQRYKYSQAQLEKFADTILYLMSNAFAVVPLTKEQEALYDKWSQTAYSEEMEMDKEESKSMFEDLMKQMFDVDVDMSDFNFSDPSSEDFANFQQKIQEDMEEKKKEEEQTEAERPKSKKEIEKENAKKAEAMLKQKSIRSIYITLAKLLHPDTETDEQLRLEKEEIMKQVTQAYQNKDLSSLLKLEMEWVHRTNEHLSELKASELNIYIEALQEQVEELENEREAQHHNPRYANILHLATLPEGQALWALREEKQELEENIQSITQDRKNLSGKGTKGAISELVNFVYEMNQEKRLMESYMAGPEGMFFDEDEEDIFDFM